MNRSRHMGKIQKRLEEVKNLSFRLAKLDFSHNESVRLATDALLDGGHPAYLKALEDEGEVDFLSTVEAQYIKRNAKEPYYSSDGEVGPRQNNDARSLQSGTYFPLVSENSEPALLHTWSTSEKPYLKEKSSATVYFQTDKNSNIRDLIRRCINKTSQVLAILMDVFTDAEIFCDILEAANKRQVFVYLLLDHSNLKLFTEMCDKLHVAEGYFKNISVRSVTGEVYCAKSGRKFSGQIQEKFIISDWRYVLSGSYSFTWLCGQVHRNFLSKFTGQVVELFDEEFRHLYASSKPVAGLRLPSHTSLFFLNKSTAATQGSLTNSSNHGSIHTPSDPFSSLSNNSGSASRKPVRTPVYNIQPTSPSPLSRGHSFHGYTKFMSTPPPNGIQVNYYQRQYVADSPAVLYNNINIYRPIRMRQEEVNRARMNPVWRCLHKANLLG
uniref:Family with sequence similarity 83 member A n=1 Tax=Anolis carolinensis TaxID=28377 RepID=H9GFC3_ANOCA|nr:PREDICTED: protein FAM83A isoform X1 [Anolis carolinensis]|eukprot:XP_003228186.1 PREDICTED: protein FAM83A isoform X1 [Anolis carolinensis]